MNHQPEQLILSSTQAAGTIIALFAAGYLCGAIPFGLLIGWLKGVDVRKQGSGNIGATNVGRVVGRSWGYLVFALDLLKGFLPTVLGGAVLAAHQPQGCIRNLLWVCLATTCVLGHMFPVYLRFKGGKGVATSLGVILGIYPYFTFAGLIVFALWIVLTLSTRYVSVGSVGAAVAFPIIFTAIAHGGLTEWGTAADLWPLHLFGAVVAVLVVYRHRSNMQRLMAGTEQRIGRPRGQLH